MNNVLASSFIALVLVCIFMGMYFIISRKYGQCINAAKRETVAWGCFFLIFSGLDYLMIVPGANYSMFAS